MMDPLALLAPICAGHPVALGGGLLFGLAAAGAAGSAVHCLPMCGPFVLGQVADRMARLPAARLHEGCRLSQGLLLPYHLGRLTTYAALGAAAAGFGGVLAHLPWFGRLRVALLILAASLFLAHALARLRPATPGAAALGRLLRRATARLDRGSAVGTYALGVALGCLPCGFLYAALVVAAAAPSVLLGGLAMLAFGLGTVPLLAAIGIAGHATGRRFASLAARFAPVVLAVNAGFLLLLAVGS